jgi:hypothetical protein
MAMQLRRGGKGDEAHQDDVGEEPDCVVPRHARVEVERVILRVEEAVVHAADLVIGASLRPVAEQLAVH